MIIVASKLAGDSALTASHVALEVGMCTSPTMIAEMGENDSSSNVVWRTPSDTCEPFDLGTLPTLLDEYTLAMTGDVVQYLHEKLQLQQAVIYFQVA